MQRHGGQTRPAGEPAAKAGATKAGATTAREHADENDRRDTKAGTAQDKSSESKD
jgi:hypothetical protein